MAARVLLAALSAALGGYGGRGAGGRAGPLAHPAAPNCSLLAGLFASAAKMKIVEEPNTFGYVAACSPGRPVIHLHSTGSGLFAVVHALARFFQRGWGAGPGRAAPADPAVGPRAAAVGVETYR